MRQDELKPRSRIGQVIAIVVVVAVFVAILYPVFAQHKGSRKSVCMSNLKQLALGMLIYADDNDDRLPFRDHWMQGATPYMRRDPATLRCDVVVKENVEGFGYAFNSLLDRRKQASIQDQAKTVMLYDSINYGLSASDPLLSLPKPGRHGGRNNGCYVDGHVSSKEIKR